MERLKGWILGLINGIDPRMLVNMIKSNDIPTLWEYQLPPYLGFVKDLVKEYREQILEQLTLDTVMVYCKEYRPDLAKILVHKRAQEWMRRFLKKIGFMLKHIDLEPYEIQMKYIERLEEIKANREAIQARRIGEMLEAEQPSQIELIPQDVVEEQLKQQERESPRIAADISPVSEEDILKALGKDKISDDYDFL